MQRGVEAETQAAQYLERQGLSLLERNYRCRQGEIDLVMQEGRTLVFVEVRSRTRSDFGGARESITRAKQARLIHAAQHYLVSRAVDAPCRFDAVLIEGGRIEWLRNAFEVAS